ncbi:hypothetical protein [Sinomonas halotolerans]|uniref:Prevent-host-death protein n=1 Tax=Sinomonas halotolerans TaxID=1644133 RepID=A0ABU9WW59_9MICC
MGASRHQIFDYTSARTGLKGILDFSARGGASVIRRSTGSAAVVDADRLRSYLESSLDLEGVTVHEDGAWAAFLPGIPVAAEATSLDEAVAELVAALREYAEDWTDHLSHAPNHRGHWGLVQLVELSTDDQLAGWLTGDPH